MSETTRSAPKTDDAAPIARKGKVPTRGVEALHCPTDADRVAKVKELKAAGLRRAEPNERPTPLQADEVN